MVFVLWTILIQVFDVKPEGIFGTNVGFATVNTWFHNLTGVHMKIYTITDWLGLVAVFAVSYTHLDVYKRQDVGGSHDGLSQWEV